MNMPEGNKKYAEHGMVSILVTMIMMVVISLIIIGISQVTRSNQREQLNQQLSSQAYYAAESGLNQAVKYFQANPASALNTTSSCSQFITGNLGGVMGTYNVLDATTNVSYTCLMVNSTPYNLQKAPLTEDSNTVWRVRDAAGNPLKVLEFKWAPNSKSRFTGATNTCAPANLPSYGNWNCAFGILRVDLVATNGTVPNSTLENPAKTLYFVPFYSSGVMSASSNAAQGQVVNVHCTASLCDLPLTVSGTANEYFVRLSMVYQSADSVQLWATETTGFAAKFAGGQAVIDVTGKAQDELRRVQARIPLTISSNPVPNFALQTTDTLCKALAVAPNVNAVDSCP